MAAGIKKFIKDLEALHLLYEEAVNARAGSITRREFYNHIKLNSSFTENPQWGDDENEAAGIFGIFSDKNGFKDVAGASIYSELLKRLKLVQDCEEGEDRKLIIEINGSFAMVCVFGIASQDGRNAIVNCIDDIKPTEQIESFADLEEGKLWNLEFTYPVARSEHDTKEKASIKFSVVKINGRIHLMGDKEERWQFESDIDFAKFKAQLDGFKTSDPRALEGESLLVKSEEVIDLGGNPHFSQENDRIFLGKLIAKISGQDAESLSSLEKAVLLTITHTFSDANGVFKDHPYTKKITEGDLFQILGFLSDGNLERVINTELKICLSAMNLEDLGKRKTIFGVGESFIHEFFQGSDFSEYYKENGVKIGGVEAIQLDLALDGIISAQKELLTANQRIESERYRKLHLTEQELLLSEERQQELLLQKRSRMLREDSLAEIRNGSKYLFCDVGDGGHFCGLLFDKIEQGRVRVYVQDSTSLSLGDIARAPEGRQREDLQEKYNNLEKKYLALIKTVYPEATSANVEIVKTVKKADGERMFVNSTTETGIQNECRYSGIIFSERVLKDFKNGKRPTDQSIRYRQKDFEDQFAQWYEQGSLALQPVIPEPNRLPPSTWFVDDYQQAQAIYLANDTQNLPISSPIYRGRDFGNKFPFQQRIRGDGACYFNASLAVILNDCVGDKENWNVLREQLISNRLEGIANEIGAKDEILTRQRISDLLQVRGEQNIIMRLSSALIVPRNEVFRDDVMSSILKGVDSLDSNGMWIQGNPNRDLQILIEKARAGNIDSSEVRNMKGLLRAAINQQSQFRHTVEASFDDWLNYDNAVTNRGLASKYTEVHLQDIVSALYPIKKVVTVTAETIPDLSHKELYISKAVGEEHFNALYSRIDVRFRVELERNYPSEVYTSCSEMIVERMMSSDPSLRSGSSNREGFIEYVRQMISEKHVNGSFNNNNRSLSQIAARFGFIELVQDFIDINPDEIEQGLLPIHIAASSVSFSKPEELLPYIKDVHVDYPDSKGRTAVMHAAMKGYAGLVKFLIDEGANPNLEDKKGLSALSHAINGEHESTSELLITYLGANFPATEQNIFPMQGASSIVADEDDDFSSDTLTQAHRDLIDKNISGDALYFLSGVTDQYDLIKSEEVIAKRIAAIDQVLARENAEEIEDSDSELSGYMDANYLLGKAHEWLTHPCPQNFDEDDVASFYETEQENLQKVSRDEQTLSLAVNDVEIHGGGTYSLQTKQGKRLQNQQYGLMGLSVADDRDHAITAQHVYYAVTTALNKVKEALVLKRDLVIQLERTDLDDDLRTIYSAIVRSENRQDPTVFTNDTLILCDRILEEKSKEPNYQEWSIELVNHVKSLKARVELKKQEHLFAKESGEFWDMYLAISLSLDPSSGGDSWDQLKSILMDSNNEEDRKIFENHVKSKAGIFDSKEVITKIDGIKRISAGNRSAIEVNPHIDRQDYVIGLLEMGRIEGLKACLKAAVGTNLNLIENEYGDKRFLEGYAVEFSKHQEGLHKPLLLKVNKPSSFKDDEFTDCDAKSYSQHIFLEKYPQSGAFADYAAVGTANENVTQNKIADTVRNNKWGFYHYSTGGHWRLVVVSPQREVICLDSVGIGEKQGLNARIRNDITQGFSRAGLAVKGSIKYYGLNTQIRLQCGLHSCLAMEEIIKSICEQQTFDADRLWKMKAMQAFMDFEIPATGEINAKESLILRRAEDIFDNQAERTFVEEICRNERISDNQRHQLRRMKTAIAAAYKEEMRQFSSANTFGIAQVIEKVRRNEDPIRKTPSDQEIVQARVNAALVQLTDYYKNSLEQYQSHENREKSAYIGANEILPDRAEFLARMVLPAFHQPLEDILRDDSSDDLGEFEEDKDYWGDDDLEPSQSGSAITAAANSVKPLTEEEKLFEDMKRIISAGGFDDFAEYDAQDNKITLNYKFDDDEPSQLTYKINPETKDLEFYSSEDQQYIAAELSQFEIDVSLFKSNVLGRYQGSYSDRFRKAVSYDCGKEAILTIMEDLPHEYLDFKAVMDRIKESQTEEEDKKWDDILKAMGPEGKANYDMIELLLDENCNEASVRKMLAGLSPSLRLDMKYPEFNEEDTKYVYLTMDQLAKKKNLPEILIFAIFEKGNVFLEEEEEQSVVDSSSEDEEWVDTVPDPIVSSKQNWEEEFRSLIREIIVEKGYSLDDSRDEEILNLLQGGSDFEIIISFNTEPGGIFETDQVYIFFKIGEAIKYQDLDLDQVIENQEEVVGLLQNLVADKDNISIKEIKIGRSGRWEQLTLREPENFVHTTAIPEEEDEEGFIGISAIIPSEEEKAFNDLLRIIKLDNDNDLASVNESGEIVLNSGEKEAVYRINTDTKDIEIFGAEEGDFKTEELSDFLENAKLYKINLLRKRFDNESDRFQFAVLFDYGAEVVREVKKTPYEYLDLDFLYQAKTTIEKALTATVNEIWISMLEKEVKDYKMIQLILLGNEDNILEFLDTHQPELELKYQYLESENGPKKECSIHQLATDKGLSREIIGRLTRVQVFDFETEFEEIPDPRENEDSRESVAVIELEEKFLRTTKTQILKDRIAEIVPSVARAVKLPETMAEANISEVIASTAKLQSLTEFTKTAGSTELKDSKFDGALLRINGQLAKAGKKPNKAIWADLSTADKNAVLDKYDKHNEENGGEKITALARKSLVSYRIVRNGKAEKLTTISEQDSERLEDVMKFARDKMKEANIYEINKQKEQLRRGKHGSFIRKGSVEVRAKKIKEELTNSVQVTSCEWLSLSRKIDATEASNSHASRQRSRTSSGDGSSHDL